jgi:hypothetical protein
MGYEENDVDHKVRGQLAEERQQRDGEGDRVATTYIGII